MIPSCIVAIIDCSWFSFSDNASSARFCLSISCGFLKDKHSLVAQDWCKEYQKDIDNCRMFLDNSPDLTDIVKEHKENEDGK